MKLLLINSYDIGGAAKACFRLQKGLLNDSISTNVLLAHKQRDLQNSFLLKKQEIKPTLKNRLEVKTMKILKKFIFLRKNVVSEKEVFLRDRPKGLEMFSFPDSKFDITESQLYQEATIVNLHWVANFIDYKSFFYKNTKPLVWTLHDMNPFTGGEHYIENYLNIDEFGIPIIRKQSTEEIRVTNECKEIKKQILLKVQNLTIVSPSEWLANEARKSGLFEGKPILCIPNGVDSEIYAPRDSNFSKEILNIPKGKKVILFVADSISNNRKGFIYLKRAFEQLADSNLVLCAIGNKNTELDMISNILELGTIHDERLMSIAYSAADVFVIPSLIDNLPNTVIESLMCGTPVIGFPVGGISEMIQNGVNGYLTETVSVNSLEKTIKMFLENACSFNKTKIRENAIKKYDQKVQSKKYIELYNNILSNATKQ